MKRRTKDDIICDIIIVILTLLVIAVGYFAIPTANAQSTQSTQKTEWVEVNSAKLPEGLEIFSGITRNGNSKYWVEIQGIKVYISETNKEHYINNTKTILLVEWYNESLNRYKYTTRQLKEQKPSQRLNLENL